MKNANEQKEKRHLSDKTKRTFKFGTNAIVLTIVVVVVAVLFTVLMEKLPMTLDFTSEKLYSISDISKNMLDKLEKDGNKKVEMTVLLDRTKAESNAYSTDYDISNVVKVLDIYDRYDCIDVKYVDPNKNPSVVTDVLGALIEKDGVINTQISTLVSDCGEGDVIVKCGDKAKIVSISEMFATKADTTYGFDYVSGVQVETVITAAVLHVTQESAPAIYFSTGYGERSMSKFSVLTFDLEFMGYSVSEIDLTKESVPSDAAILFFMGPKQDLSARATEQLEEWFANSRGSAVFMMDTDNAGTDLPNFNYIFNLFGLRINNDIVKEASSKSIAGNTYAFKTTTITQGAFGTIPNTEVTVENSRSISLVDDGIQRCDSYPLVQTTRDAKTISIPGGKESGESIQTVMASGEYFGGTTEAKIILSGSSENVVDHYQYGNRMSGLLLKAVNWMYESTLENEATEIDAKIYNTTTVSVTEKQSRWIAIGCIIVYPLIILSCGLVVWLKRRHL